MIRTYDNEMVGKKFGRLLPIEKAPSRHGRTCWLCQCDCGKTKVVLGENLRKGKTKSCGCIRRELALNSVTYAREQHYLPPGEAAFNVMFYVYKTHASERNLVFELDQTQFRTMTKKNCFYCGDEPKTLFKPKAPHGGYLSNGVDRKDNNIGYTTENSVTCCRVCNQMKSDRSYDGFIARCERIIRGHKPSVIKTE
jgi:hypothetical protein